MQVGSRAIAITSLMAVGTLSCSEPLPPSSVAPSVVDPVAALWASPLLFESDAARLAAGAGELSLLVERVSDSALRARAPAERVVLQNDLWGVFARAERAPVSSVPLTRLARAARDAGVVLAGTFENAPPFVCDALPPAARAHLREEDGWHEAESEMPVLSHEAAFGLRRVFRVLMRGSERALTSQLLFIDGAGVAHRSCVVGDLEILDVGPEGAQGAHLFELVRERLSSGADGALVETGQVAHVPGLGADSFFLELSPPIPVRELPCRRCHDDDVAMSLPRLDRPIGGRIPPLLRQAAERFGAR